MLQINRFGRNCSPEPPRFGEFFYAGKTTCRNPGEAGGIVSGFCTNRIMIDPVPVDERIPRTP